MNRIRTRFVACAAGALVAPAALAVTTTWTGLGDGVNWSDPANWDNGVPIDATFDAVIPAGFDVTFDLVGATVVNNLELAGGSSLSLEPTRDLTVQQDAFVGGFINADNASFTSTVAPSFTGAGALIDAIGGASVSFAATTYTHTSITSGDLFLAQASSIDLSALTTLRSDNNPFGGNVRRVRSIDGGAIDLSALTSVIGPGGDDVLEFFTANGGTIDLASLTELASGNVRFNSDTDVSLPLLTTARGLSFAVPASATIDLPALEQFRDSTLTAPDAGVLNAPNLTVFENSTLNLTGGATLNIPSFDSIDNSRFNVSGGASFAVNDTVYDITGITGGAVVDVSGPSMLDLSSVTEIIATNNPFGANVRTLRATDGATLDLSGLTTVRGPDGDDVLEFLQASGGVLDLPALASIELGRVRFALNDAIAHTLPDLTNASAVDWRTVAGATIAVPSLTTQSGGSIEVPSGATFDAPALTTLNNTTLTVDAGGAFDAPLLTDFDGSTLNLGPNQTVNVPAFDSIDNARFFITGGASYAAADTAYTIDSITGGTIVSVSGFDGASPSLLDLSSANSLSSTNNPFGANTRTLQAVDQGILDLSGLHTIDGPSGDDRLQLRAASGGLIDLTSLQSVASGNVLFNVEAEGTILVDSLTVTSNLEIRTADPSSTFAVAGSLLLDPGARLNAGSGSTIEIGGNFSHAVTDETQLQATTAILEFPSPSGARDAGRIGEENIRYLEAAGLDQGAMDPGNNGNFGFGQLVVGSDGGPGIFVVLQDVVDNGNRGGSQGGPEALYLYSLGGPSGLVVNAGSTFVINNLNVYFQEDGAWVHLNSLFPEGEVTIPFDNGFVTLPTPGAATLVLLAAGALSRRRR